MDKVKCEEVGDFNGFFECSFVKDERIAALEDRVSKYYRDTEHLDNRESASYSKELMMWVRSCGYTGEEFTRAKQYCS